MKTTHSTWTRRLTAAALTAAVTAPLALSSAFAQNTPTALSNWSGNAQVETVGYRDGDRLDNRNRRGRYNRGRRDRGRNDRNVRQNFSGVVIGGVRGNQFEMRANGGRTITVVVRQSGQARKISRGDRVTVAGYFRNGNIFEADDLNFIRNR